MYRHKIVQFSDNDVEDASQLLAARHEANRQSLSMLPESFESAETASVAIEAVWKRPHAVGVAAFQNEQLVGFLIGYHLSGSLSDRSGWIPLGGHAVDNAHSPEIYHELYAALAEQWVDLGIFQHHIIVSAGDEAALGKWFRLSFGQQQAHGVRKLSDDDQFPSIRNGLTIRRATPDDAEVVAAIADTNVRYQNGSPIFAPTPPEYLDDLREGYVELLSEPDEGTLWLALQGGAVIGYLALTFVEDDPTNLFIPAKSIELPAAGIIKSVRGQGFGRILTQYCFAQAKADGFDYIVADWRTTNMLASRFWIKNGFVPVAYRLQRQIDPQIGWARLR